MKINQLLRRQLAPVLTSSQTVSKELLDLIETISSTYDYFEEKLKSAGQPINTLKGSLTYVVQEGNNKASGDFPNSAA